ncbi:MAG: IreB family regulatory phosphoprotein [Negativicutes bacterium]|nr:IreB family regulatory phosphoprotein [Negativicutes bacterium]
MGDNLQDTRQFKLPAEEKLSAPEILAQVYTALEEKGYNPVNQIVGFLLSGDPAYITSHRNARTIIRRVPRDELLEEIVRSYLDQCAITGSGRPA